jgi:hypothetical protein
MLLVIAATYKPVRTFEDDNRAWFERLVDNRRPLEVTGGHQRYVAVGDNEWQCLASYMLNLSLKNRSNLLVGLGSLTFGERSESGLPGCSPAGGRSRLIGKVVVFS